MTDWRDHDTSKCGPLCKLCRAIDVVDGLNAEYEGRVPTDGSETNPVMTLTDAPIQSGAEAGRGPLHQHPGEMWDTNGSETDPVVTAAERQRPLCSTCQDTGCPFLEELCSVHHCPDCEPAAAVERRGPDIPFVGEVCFMCHRLPCRCVSGTNSDSTDSEGNGT